jgi:hypothetical protein
MTKMGYRYSGAASLIVVTALAVYLLLAGRAKSGAQPVPIFYGLVTDARGRPLEGAEVDVVTSALTTNPMTGGAMMGKSGVQQVVVVSDRDGRFSVRLEGGRNVVQIRGVTKAGFSWVFDWLWDLGRPPDRLSNREFILQGPLMKDGGYFPDVTNPAIFPMYGVTDSTLSQYPSRGGNERNPFTGKYEPNVPVKPRVPSTGPSAPNPDTDSVNVAISQYIRDHARK